MPITTCNQRLQGERWPLRATDRRHYLGLQVHRRGLALHPGVQVQLEEDMVSPVGERDVRRLWVALALGPGLGYSHLDLFVGIDIHKLVRSHICGDGDDRGRVVHFGDGGEDNAGARERKSTVVGTDMHKHEQVHTPFQRHPASMIGHKQTSERKTMVGRLYIGIENVGDKCRCKDG